MSYITLVYLGPYIEVRAQWHPVVIVGRPPDLFKVLGNDSLLMLEPIQVVDSVAVIRIVPNEYRGDPRVFHRKRLGFSYPDLDDLRDEQHWFDIAFAPEIEKIMEAYGPSNVSFHWGSIVNTED